MSRFKKVGGRYGMHSGSARFKNLEIDSNMWLQGNAVGLGCQGTIYYVKKLVDSSGDGKSWDGAFKTITLGIAALENYDWLIIGPGNYDEAAAITLTSKIGCRILGYSTGFQWGEGLTCWRDVTSGADMFTLTNCKGVEIAGISFISSQAFDSLKVSGHSIYIHHCSFTGDTGGGATGLRGLDISGGPDTYVHDCKFFHYNDVGCRVTTNQRFVMHDCLFIVPDAKVGCYISAATTTYGAIWNCYFLGSEGDGADQGLSIAASSDDGKLMVADCRFAGCIMTGGGTGAEVASVENYKNTSAGGVLIDPT